MKRNPQSGQVILVFMMITTVVILSAVSYTYFNSTSAKHVTASQKETASVGLVEEGLQYAIRVLSTSTTVWGNALSGSFPAELTTAGAPSVYTASNGGKFRIVCSTSSSLGAYQVQILVTSLTESAGSFIPQRTLRAVVSRKGLNATVNNTQSVPAALDLGNVPVVNGTLTVHWGPVVVNSANQWTLPGMMEYSRYPRKFSRGPITGATYSRAPSLAVVSTDNQEYWAYSSIGFPGLVNASSYAASAAANIVSAPTSTATGSSLTATPAGYGYFNVSNDTAIFNAGSSGYTVSSPASVVYVNGNAEFRNVAIDLKPTSGNNFGAFYVSGNLTLGDRTSTTGINNPYLRVPKTASKEYPYTPSQTNWPCRGNEGTNTTCQPLTPTGSSYVPYRGFLYVGGNLTVKSGNTWVIVGALKVEGTLTVQSNANLYVLYDDDINRGVQLNNLELQIDSVSDVQDQ